MAPWMNRTFLLFAALACISEARAQPILPASGYFADACRVEDNVFGANQVTREFSPAGRLEVERIDSGIDGSVDEVRLYSYDNSGRVSRIVFQAQPLVEVRRYEARYYSADGRYEWSKTVFPRPTVHVGDRVRIERDVGGRVVRETHFAGTPPTVARIEDWAYDPFGLPLRRSDYVSRSGGEPVLQAIHRFEHDDANLLLRQLTDEGGDGSVDEVTRFQYDGQGRLVGTQTDVGVDGTWDWSFQREWEDDRQLVHEAIDWDMDGETDVETLFDFDCGD